MDNQQVTLTKLAWLAGIWDGEGSISITRCASGPHKKSPKYVPSISVYNTDEGLIHEVGRILDGLGVRYRISDRMRLLNQTSKIQTKRPQYVLGVRAFSHTQTTLQALIPYLFLKKERAQILNEFIASRFAQYEESGRTWGSGGPGTLLPYTGQQFDLVAAIFIANGDQRNTSTTVRDDATKAMIQSDLQTKAVEVPRNEVPAA